VQVLDDEQALDEVTLIRDHLAGSKRELWI
jgi:hypothetical protein